MGTYRRLIKLSKPFLPKLMMALGFSAIAAVFNAASMYLVKLVTDDVLVPKTIAGQTLYEQMDQVSQALVVIFGINPESERTDLLMALLVIYPLLIVSVMFVKGLFNYFAEVYRKFVGHSIVLESRKLLYEKYTSLPLSFHSRQRLGDLTVRVTNDSQLVQSGVTDVVGRIGAAGLNILCLAGLIFYINWKFAVQVLVIFPIAMGPLYFFGKRIRKYSTMGLERMAVLNALLHECLAGIRVVFSFHMEKIERERFVKAAKEYFEAVMRQDKIQALSSPVMDLIGGTGVALMIFLAGRAVVMDDLRMGEFLAMMGAISSMYPQVKHLNGVNVAIQNSLAAAVRIFDILDTDEHLIEKSNAVVVAPISGSFKFENVNFEYNAGKKVLRDINLEVYAGKRLAIVGPSGSGKTTLVDLVPRFHDPVDGAISLDGIDLRDATLESLRGQIGLVTQETFLFNDTIAANIGYGKPGAAQKDIENAAKAANAHEFILEQKNGYETEIGERGVRLSGGQRQRLSIARAILKNPPILILDEATSALDTESERLVQDALETLMARRTTMVIAHRLSTVIHADDIIVLEEGAIVERGKHDDLLEQDGLYAKLYKMQFRTETKKDDEAVDESRTNEEGQE